MTRRLIAYVHVDGVAYGPDDDMPASVAKRIGAHAWTDETDTVQLPDEDGEDDGDRGIADPPPRAGRGSGVDAWRKFAEQNGVGTDSDMTREDIIAAAEQAGLVEPEQPKE